MTKNWASTVGGALVFIGVGIYALAGFLVPADVDLRSFVELYRIEDCDFWVMD